MAMYPKLTEITVSVLDDFKEVRTQAMAMGGVATIDIAIYMTTMSGQVYLGHSEVIVEQLPPRKFVKAVHELVRSLRQAAPEPWRFMSMCLDTWIAPDANRDWSREWMGRDYSENPASDVLASIAVFTVDSEGVEMLAYAPYRISDHGLPEWGETRTTGNPPGFPPKVLAHAAMA